MQPGKPPGLICKSNGVIGVGHKRRAGRGTQARAGSLSRKDITVILYHIICGYVI